MSSSRLVLVVRSTGPTFIPRTKGPNGRVLVQCQFGGSRVGCPSIAGATDPRVPLNHLVRRLTTSQDRSQSGTLPRRTITDRAKR